MRHPRTVECHASAHRTEHDTGRRGARGGGGERGVVESARPHAVPHIAALHDEDHRGARAAPGQRRERVDVPRRSLAHRVGEVAPAVLVDHVAILDLDVVWRGGGRVQQKVDPTRVCRLALRLARNCEAALGLHRGKVVQPLQHTRLQQRSHQPVRPHCVGRANQPRAIYAHRLDRLPREPELALSTRRRQQPDPRTDLDERLHPARVDAVGEHRLLVRRIVQTNLGDEAIAPVD